MGWLLLGGGLIFFAPLIGVLLGAFSGWIVSLFFDDTIRLTLLACGVQLGHLELWQLGATLGFISGFFRSVQGNRS